MRSSLFHGFKAFIVQFIEHSIEESLIGVYGQQLVYQLWISIWYICYENSL